MQEDAQIDVCCFRLALVGGQARVKTKALWALCSAFTHYSYFPSPPFLYSDPASESLCPKGTLLKSMFQLFIPIQQFAGSVNKVMQVSRITCRMPRIGALYLGGQEARGIVIAASCCFLHGTQQIPTTALLACADPWSKVAWVLSYAEVWEVIAILSQSVP